MSSFVNAPNSPNMMGFTTAVNSTVSRATVCAPETCPEVWGRLLGFETYPRRPGGMRPFAGIACRPSVRRTMPAASIPCATARRARTSAKTPLLALKATKYVTRLGLSRYVARKRGSWRRASASAGRRSDASENRPARNSERISSGGTPNRKTTPSFFG